MSFQFLLLITLLASVMEVPWICYVQPRNLNLGKSKVFLRKSSHPVFIKMALVFHFIASNKGLVVSIHMAFFVMFMIAA